MTKFFAQKCYFIERARAHDVIHEPTSASHTTSTEKRGSALLALGSKYSLTDIIQFRFPPPDWPVVCCVAEASLALGALEEPPPL
jgi:hypothetical protein